MSSRPLQITLAYGAMLMLPWVAIRPVEQAVTFGDLLLIGAVALNIDRIRQISGWQVAMLASLPFMVFSQVADPDSSLIELLQTLYIFGFVIPFGWLAFVDIRPRYLVYTLLISLGISSIVAGLQVVGLIDEVGRQSIWMVAGATRSAGLNISCSGLCMSLTPLFPLLMYVPGRIARIAALITVSVGVAATLAKSAIFGAAGMAYYLVREPHRRAVVGLMALACVSAVSAWVLSEGVRDRAEAVALTIEYRVSKTEQSMAERSSTLRYALSYLNRCRLLGLGYARTSKELEQNLGNTVHVFHVGLILAGGFPAAILHFIGLGLLIRDTWRSGHGPAAAMMLCHLLAVCTMTVLMLSFQYVAYLMCAAILGYQRQFDAALTDAAQVVESPLPDHQPAVAA